MKKTLLMLGIAAGLASTLATAASKAPAASQARECGCKDLPTMTRELNEQEFLQKLFQGWADYMPREIATVKQLQDRAQREFNQAFYSQNGGAAAGTAHGGHAAFGTDLNDANCPIVVYLYDDKGKKILDKEGNHATKPIEEKDYKSKQCAALTRFAFVHERAHQQTCKKAKQTAWQSPEFFARDDAAAYRAGADALREEITKLAGQCGWDNSTKNRLPSVQEAQDLAKRAAKARPVRRRK